VSDNIQTSKMSAYLTKHGWIGTPSASGRILIYRREKDRVCLYVAYSPPEFEVLKAPNNYSQEGNTLAELVVILMTPE
jgi:hypothetical protein